MNREAFKQRMQNLKSYRENNPGKGYWDWKVETFQDGGRTNSEYQMKGYYSNHTGTPTMYLPTTEQNGEINVHTPEITITPKNNISLEAAVDRGRRSAFKNIKEVASYTPIVGDVMDVSDAVYEATQGNYSKAALYGGIALLPNILEKPLKKIVNKYSKKGFITSLYNNIAPGSYYDSYIHNGTKKDEIKNAIKDYLLGKGDVVAPKWEEWIKDKKTIGSFISRDSNPEYMSNIIADARKEAWQNYLGIPHEDKYLINTGAVENGLPVYRSNITAIPESQLQKIVESTIDKAEEIPYVFGDMINSTGGNISIRYADDETIRKINMQDVWDINPFQDANRAKILPEFIKKKYAHVEVQDDGYNKLVWNNNAPKWLVNLEPSKLLGIPGPFLNKTSFNAKKLNKQQITKKIPLSKEEFINERFNHSLELLDPTGMSEKEFYKWKDNTYNLHSDKWDQLMKTDPQNKSLFRTTYLTHQELLKKYGAYVLPRFTDGGQTGDPEKERFYQATGRSSSGRPLEEGLKPMFSLENAANMTPIGDAISARDTYNAVKERDWLGAGLAAATMIPFVPMTVKQFRRKYKGVTPKTDYKAQSKLLDQQVQNQINAFDLEKARREIIINRATNLTTQANNEGYKIIERLMDDPSYIERAAEVKKNFGDNYLRVYSDLLQDYNIKPNNLPKATLDSNIRGRAEMRANPQATDRVNNGGKAPDRGEFEFAIDPLSTDLSGNVTTHEMNHYTDFILNKSRNADGNSNMFYQMSKDLDGVKIDRDDWYYRKPTEQKAYMNQIREYLFENGKINKRNDKVTTKTLNDAIRSLSSNKDYDSAIRASRQFRNMRSYTKWFNTIPLLGVGTIGVNSYFKTDNNE